MFEWKVNELSAKNSIILGEKSEAEGRPFKARFLQAGLVKYPFGVCLLKKETIDKFVNTFMACPVIINHKDKIDKSDLHGDINNIWFSPEDGWYWCSGTLDDEAAKKVEDGFNVSCQYRITEYLNNDDNKLHNGNKYDKEILNGVFEHLAIVKNPRYEDAYIAVNAILATNGGDGSVELKTTASNSFISNFKDMLYNAITEGIYCKLKARNGWITKYDEDGEPIRIFIEGYHGEGSAEHSAKQTN